MIYREVNYEITPVGNNMKLCVGMLDGKEFIKFWSSEITDETVRKQIDHEFHKIKIDKFIVDNREQVMRLTKTYELKDGYGSYQSLQAYKWVKNHYSEDHDALRRLMFKVTAQRENVKLGRTIDHFGEMTMREFKYKLMELTSNKVCVNGGKAYLHIYNWYYKNGKKTCYRTSNYYITIGQNFNRTEENAKMIAAKCLEFAAIENYGQNEKVPVEKF
jgi:hypothetical protein